MEKTIKTNAMRILDLAHIPYTVHTYAHGKEAVEGKQVAAMLQQPLIRVFKTLIVVAPSHTYYVFMLPVNHELDLKKCAKVVHEKTVDMIQVKDITKITGYVRGGCSPLGMKKAFHTVVHETCLQHSTIYFSGGKIGLQIEADPSQIIVLLHAQCANIIQD